jgi:hypothetical protein
MHQYCYQAGMRRVLLAALLLSLLIVANARAAESVAWSVTTVSEPSHFATEDRVACETELKCDQYQVLVRNVGNTASSGTITLTDKLPPGIVSGETPVSGHDKSVESWNCTEGGGNAQVTCTFSDPVPAGGFAPFLDVSVSAPSALQQKEYADFGRALVNEVAISGAGATEPHTTSTDTPVTSVAPAFAPDQVAVEPTTAGGTPADSAGGHPWELSTSMKFPSVFSPPSEVDDHFAPIENIKSIVAELPRGFVGDPFAAEQCTETELRREGCPPASEVGVFAVIGGAFQFGEFQFTGAEGAFPGPGGGCCSAVYNIVPQGGYPAELGLSYAGQTIFLYANLVRDGGGYHIRVVAPSIPTVLELMYSKLTIFGAPGMVNGGGSASAFLTNPTDCTAGELPSHVVINSWEQPSRALSVAAPTYAPAVTSCSRLHFGANIGFGPAPGDEEGTNQVDSPSAYNFSLSIPQTTAFTESATPDVKDVRVALPSGVSVSPSAATSLVGCDATGPEGINIGSSEIGPGGRDEGDPEATVFGANRTNSSESGYDDGLYHTARGHCPAGSMIGTAEVKTPLVAEPLKGHLYLAKPGCGGEGQQACTEASATNGELFGLYLEIGGEPGEKSGVIVKLKGTVGADPGTGQLTATFRENPEVPFSKLTIHTHGGANAPLSNPQTCGGFTTASDIEPWSAPATPDATPTGEMTIDNCSNFFAPSFTAGSSVARAGAPTQFTLAVSRHDGEPNLASISETMPPGLVGMVAQVPQCPEPQASEGTCPESSRLGSVSAQVGAGGAPFVANGTAYLTGPYHGAPFGLSIVVPAKAGPFNLGDVVVRSAITIDPDSAAVTVTSDVLPQLKDGVQLRIKNVTVMIDRPGFIVNPTNCSQQNITGRIEESQGAVAQLSSPFAVSGCRQLAFNPRFTAATGAKTSKLGGVSFDVKVSYSAGAANIKAVKVDLPTQLPSRLTTLQRACRAAVFAANPANCPVGSIVGIARASTLVLSGPLMGPAYLVSHGGEAFPDLVVVLQGDGVRVDLTGKTTIKRGVTSSNFAELPDVPVSSFELFLPQGRFSILGVNGSLCAHALKMPTMITGQNGVVLKRTTTISVAGCPKANVKKKKHSKQGKRGKK